MYAAEPLALYSLIAPAGGAAVGTTIEVQLAVLNRSDHAVPITLPNTLTGEIEGKAGTARVTLRARNDGRGASQSVEPGRFALHPYLLTIPRETPPGRVTLGIASNETGTQRTAFELTSAPAVATAETAHSTDRPTTSLARSTPAMASLGRVFADRIGAHEPIYFIYGPDDPAAKFQFSFKYKLLQFTDPASPGRARTLQFGFTQRSLWDIDGVSSPFYDTSYMPELIYESLAPESAVRDRRFAWLGFQAAYKHESNGRDGPLSRSLNTVYARSVFIFGRIDRWHVLAIPEVFTYVTSEANTADIEDYRGYGKLHLVVGRPDGPSLMATAWAGKDLDHSSIQLDLTVPVRTKLLNFETYLLLQYFNGYGESLLSYKEQSETIRAGFSLVR
jgi:phospholipase A1